MEKLTRLINEYGKTYKCGPFEDCRVEPTSDYYYTSYLVLQWDDNGEGDWKDWHLPIPTLISKDYGFIKWLVENDKIDFSREGNLSNELVDLFERRLDTVEGVIALLSIQDEPIEFLISILK